MPTQTTLKSLALRYVRERVARGEITKETAEQYTSRLLTFAAFAPTDPAKVTRRHVQRWLERPGLSQHYRRARLTVLRGFFRWCVLYGHLRRDPTLGEKLPPLPPLLPRHLGEDEMAELMDVVAGDPRTRLAVLLMVQEMLRRGEVARIQLGDIDRRQRVLSVRGKGGRGHVTRREPITEETWAALVTYLPIVGASSGPLFRSERWPDRGISGAWIGELVTRAMREAGVKHYSFDGRSPHALRHTGAQDLVDAGRDIRKVQKALGHASIRSTEWYTRGSVGDLREVLEGRTYARRRLASVG